MIGLFSMEMSSRHPSDRRHSVVLGLYQQVLTTEGITDVAGTHQDFVLPNRQSRIADRWPGGGIITYYSPVSGQDVTIDKRSSIKIASSFLHF